MNFSEKQFEQQHCCISRQRLNFKTLKNQNNFMCCYQFPHFRFRAEVKKVSSRKSFSSSYGSSQLGSDTSLISMYWPVAVSDSSHDFSSTHSWIRGRPWKIRKILFYKIYILKRIADFKPMFHISAYNLNQSIFIISNLIIIWNFCLMWPFTWHFVLNRVFAEQSTMDFELGSDIPSHSIQQIPSTTCKHLK